MPNPTTGVTGLAIAASTFLLLPFAIAMAVRMMRRDAPTALPPQQGHDASERLERLERARWTRSLSRWSASPKGNAF